MDIEYRLAKCSDLEGIYNIEKQSFLTPWHFESLEYDVCDNQNSLYVVALYSDEIVGFCGVHIVLDECHINNIAVLPTYRRAKIGQGLIEILMSSIGNITKVYWLEVRQSNIAAKNLYAKFGFEQVTIRKKYYTDTEEDAIVMCKTCKNT